jgi:PAS domain S-box-containing protein
VEPRIPVSMEIIRDRSEIAEVSRERRWILWVLQDVALWKLMGPINVERAQEHLPQLWKLLLRQRDRWGQLFVILDLGDFALQTQEVRQYLASAWSGVLDRDDITICAIDPHGMRRTSRTAMLRLFGKTDRLRIFRDYSAAIRFVNDKRQTDVTGRTELPGIAEQLSSQHALFADSHGSSFRERSDSNRAELQFQELMEDSPLAVHYCDLQGRFLWGNRAAEELSGHSRGELTGLPYYRTGLLSGEELLKVSRILATSLLKTSSGPHEFTVARKDGAFRFVELWAHLASFGNREVLLCTTIDISDRKLQDALRETDRAREKVGRVCMQCNKIRNKNGQWLEFTAYHLKYARLQISHGICPECSREHYAEYSTE